MKVIRRQQQVLAILRVFPPTVSLPAAPPGIDKYYRHQRHYDAGQGP